MSVHLRNALIGVGVAVVVTFLASLLDFGNLAIMPAMGFAAFVWFLLESLASNRKVNNVPDADRAKALASVPPPGTGLVYIYREGFIGKAVGVDVAVDNRVVAQLKSPRFTVVAVPPGDHTLAAAMKGLAGAQNKGGAISFSINQGETLVFCLKMKMGLVEGAVAINREPNPHQVLGKLSMITMVAPEPV